MKFYALTILIIFRFSYAKGLQCFGLCLENIFSQNETKRIYPALLLIIDGSNITLLDNDIHPQKEVISNLYFACPGETKNEININKNESRTHNSMFIEKVKDQNELQLCKSLIKPSVILVNKISYSIGYEIYLGEDDLYKKVYKRTTEGLNEKFRWFFIINIRFDHFLKTTQLLSYFLSGHNNLDNATSKNTLKYVSWEEKTQNFDIGKELIFKDEDMSYYYSIQNQEKVFGDIFKNLEEKLKYFDPNNKKFLEKQFLAEPQDFLFNNYKEAVTTHANVVPMWKTIKDGAWKNLNIFLREPLVGDEMLFITTGIYETLRLPNENLPLNEEGPSEPLSEIFLANKTVPVPYAFWKFIQYFESIQYENEKTVNTYYEMIVIVHNNPYEKDPKILCEKNICQENGWDHIENLNPETGFTYCCKPEPDIINKLHIATVTNRGTDPTPLKILKLKKNFI